jgi:hypothetical protein
MPYAISAAHGATVKIGNAASPEVFTAIQGIHNGPQGLDDVWNIIQARHHGSTSTHQKRTFKEPSSLTFDIYYDSTDAQHIALLAAARAGTRKNYQLVITDAGAEAFAFAAYASASLSAEVEGFNVYSITLAVDGDVTVS